MNRVRYGADHDMLDVMQEYKAEALTEASARIGAILAGASPGEEEAISKYARETGLCLIAEDPLKATPTTEGPGKDATSAGQRAALFVEVYGPLGARHLAEEVLERALETPRRVPGGTSCLIALTFSVRDWGLMSQCE